MILPGMVLRFPHATHARLTAQDKKILSVKAGSIRSIQYITVREKLRALACDVLAFNDDDPFLFEHTIKLAKANIIPCPKVSHMLERAETLLHFTFRFQPWAIAIQERRVENNARQGLVFVDERLRAPVRDMNVGAFIVPYYRPNIRFVSGLRYFSGLVEIATRICAVEIERPPVIMQGYNGVEDLGLIVAKRLYVAVVAQFQCA
jgi:hypothetical protein